MFDPSDAPRDCREPERKRITNEELAERFGRFTINGMISGQSPEWVYEAARLAGSFARQAAEERAAKIAFAREVAAWSGFVALPREESDSQVRR